MKNREKYGQLDCPYRNSALRDEQDCSPSSRDCNLGQTEKIDQHGVVYYEYECWLDEEEESEKLVYGREGEENL